MVVEKPNESCRGRGEAGRPDGGFFVHSIATEDGRYKGIGIWMEGAEANVAGLLGDSVADMERWIGLPHSDIVVACKNGGFEIVKVLLSGNMLDNRRKDDVSHIGVLGFGVRCEIQAEATHICNKILYAGRKVATKLLRNLPHFEDNITGTT